MLRRNLANAGSERHINGRFDHQSGGLFLFIHVNKGGLCGTRLKVEWIQGAVYVLKRGNRGKSTSIWEMGVVLNHYVPFAKKAKHRQNDSNF